MTESLAERKDKEERQRLNAQEAMALLQNPLLRAALLELNDEWTKEMTQSKLDDSPARDMARYKLEALRLVAGSLRHHMETGKLIAVSGEQADEMSTFLKDYGL
jgi:hypothetical protein